MSKTAPRADNTGRIPVFIHNHRSGTLKTFSYADDWAPFFEEVGQNGFISILVAGDGDNIEAGNMNVLQGHADRGQIDTSRILSRHDEVVNEMLDRGYNHESPLTYEDELQLGTVDEASNLTDLADRCDDCRERIDSSR
ncbi:hypothetical protein [Haloarchaeobius sp. TZWWS8]|uniref:hypothetical protein n=1 Tax=Haloarchaeobius sp. TZWWS8 TaxID=3446121 RepID=UPI003EB8B0CC